SPRFTDRVVCCRAGGNDTHVGAVQAELHRDEATCHVAEQHWNREWRIPGRSFGQEDCQLILEGFQSDDSTTDDDTETFALFAVLYINLAVSTDHFLYY